MDKTYQPKAIEEKWYHFWEQNGYFVPDSSKSQTYCIMIPPPNVTGNLHMGHGFQYSLMDALIRYQRMQGKQVLWQVGTDHAGISTQMVVERQLEQQGLSRKSLGREKFIEAVWQWKKTSGNNITQQMRRLGNSVDWSRERFTLDPAMSKAVQTVFIELFDQGLIYRGKKLVNWDPNFCSAISDVEVINQPEAGHLWHICYPLTCTTNKTNSSLIVATTRPETLLGDVAVAVHPKDERYHHLIGKKISLPLTDRTIPIIADNYVDPTFGSGCVKITPAHDFNDYEIGIRHNLPLINIFTPDARLNAQVPSKYQGIERFAAREKILEDLQAAGLLIKTEAYTVNVPRADRGNTIIEPYLTDQWFVNTTALAEPAIEAVKSGKIEFIPENWKNTYFQWMENIQDWCISRQLWWGHRIPAWYDQAGNIYVGQNETVVRQKYALAADISLRQDEDVLDTWFSSALWPFSTLGWPNASEDFSRFYPTDILVTGFDIIFFWVARMIMMGLKFTDQIPFKKVYFTGLIKDAQGQKMSKTKGNVIDPIDLIDGVELATLIQKRTTSLMQPWMKEKIEKATKKEFPQGILPYGTDALRFTYCALASTGRDIRFDLNRLAGYRNFCNKLWNAARYVMLQAEKYPITLSNKIQLIPNRWIQSRLQKTILTVRDHLDHFRFDLATQSLYDFVWHEFCDWYLELAKILLSNEQEKSNVISTMATLLLTLKQILLLLHPFMPFITEEIADNLKNYCATNTTCLMLSEYPQYQSQKLDNEAETSMAWLQRLVNEIRNLRGEMNLSPAIALPVRIFNLTSKDRQFLETHQTFLFTLARLKSLDLDLSPSLREEKNCATAIIGQMEISIPLAGLIDTTQESKRLQKEIAKLEKDVLHYSKKLNNPKFIANAPAQVVKQDKDRLMQAQTAMEKLKAKLAQF